MSKEKAAQLRDDICMHKRCLHWFQERGLSTLAHLQANVVQGLILELEILEGEHEDE